MISLISNQYVRIISGNSSLCWAFAIATMLRQSLKMFLSNLNPVTNLIRPHKIAEALAKLSENKFHVRLRNEIIMLPIPKAKMFDHKVPIGMNRDDYEDYIVDKQSHILKAAFERVSINITSH